MTYFHWFQPVNWGISVEIIAKGYYQWWVDDSTFKKCLSISLSRNQFFSKPEQAGTCNFLRLQLRWYQTGTFFFLNGEEEKKHSTKLNENLWPIQWNEESISMIDACCNIRDLKIISYSTQGDIQIEL